MWGERPLLWEAGRTGARRVPAGCSGGHIWERWSGKGSRPTDGGGDGGEGPAALMPLARPPCWQRCFRPAWAPERLLFLGLCSSRLGFCTFHQESCPAPRGGGRTGIPADCLPPASVLLPPHHGDCHANSGVLGPSGIYMSSIRLIPDKSCQVHVAGFLSWLP